MRRSSPCSAASPRTAWSAAPEGWWPELVGPAHGIDTDNFRVLGIDYLGGRGESSTPEPGGRFPPLSSYDQAQALERIVEHLGIGRCTPSWAPPTAAWWRSASPSVMRRSSDASWS